MTCCNKPAVIGCKNNIKTYGICDASSIKLDGSDRTKLNWNEISIPELVSVPVQKPDIEHLDQVFVEAKLNCAHLIETPFAYRSYERLATTFEVTAAINAITIADIDLTNLLTLVNNILAIPGLPSIPAVAALQAALAAVTTAGTNLTTAVTAALVALDAPCIAASAVIVLVNSVTAALNVLQSSLNLLTQTAKALITATASIPIIGGLVATAVNLLLTEINAVILLINTALTGLLGVITLIGYTNVLEIIPNEEGSCLSGRKIVIEGELIQKMVYTALVDSQSVHSFCNKIPFNVYIIPYAKFEGLTYTEDIEVIIDPAVPCGTKLVDGYPYDPNKEIKVDLCEEFSVNSCIEDIFAYAVDKRNIFKNITVFLLARPMAC